MNGFTLLVTISEGLNLYKKGDKYYEENPFFVVVSKIPGIEGIWDSNEEGFYETFGKHVPHLEGHDDTI